MSGLPNLIYKFNTIPVNIPENHFVHIKILILKYILREKRPRTANAILKEKDKVGRQSLPEFKKK